MKFHPSITVDRILSLTEASMMDGEMTGICNECGEEQCGVEPDAQRYHCESCGEPAVYGVEEIMMRMSF